MSEDHKNLEKDVQAQAVAELPVLTLNPSAGDKLQMEKVMDELDKVSAQEPVAPDVQAAIAKQLDSGLSDEERRAVESFSKQIDISNSQHVMLYGADAQKKV